MYEREYPNQDGAAQQRAVRAGKRKREDTDSESDDNLKAFNLPSKSPSIEKEALESGNLCKEANVLVNEVLDQKDVIMRPDNVDGPLYAPRAIELALRHGPTAKGNTPDTSTLQVGREISPDHPIKAPTKMNASQLAAVIGEKSRAFHLQLFEELKDKHPAAFFRLAQFLLKCNSTIDVDARFRDACRNTTSRSRKIYEFLVPKDVEDYKEDFDGLISYMLEQRDQRYGYGQKTLAGITAALENCSVSEPASKSKPSTHPKIKLNITKPDPTTAIMDAIDLEVIFRRGARPDSRKQQIISSIDTQRSRATRIRMFEKGIERQAVRAHNMRYVHSPRGRRSIDCVRNAFDITLLNRRGPKQPWRSSDEFFIKTLEVIDTNPEVCLLWTQPDSRQFLEGMEFAMNKAEEWRAEELLLSRSLEEYADLLGCENGSTWRDDYQPYYKEENDAGIY